MSKLRKIVVILCILVLISLIFILNMINQNNVKDEETHATVRKVVQTYINEYKYYENNRVGTFPSILEKLNLETEENLNKLLEDNLNNDEDFKTNVKYEDFKEVMLKMVTEEYFNKNFSNYLNIDGYVGVNNGAGGIIAIEFEDIEFVSYDANSNTYLYNVKIKDLEEYYIYSEEEDSGLTLEDCYFYCEIYMKNVNNNMVIDNIL